MAKRTKSGKRPKNPNINRGTGNVQAPSRNKNPGRSKKKGGGGGLTGPKSLLHHPDELLRGKRLYKASNELTRLELRPALKGYLRQEKAIERQRAAAEQGLYQLGERTGRAVGGAYDALNAAGGQTIARQQALAQSLGLGTQQINNQAAANLQGMQTGVLGGLTESLSARNVDPGGSAAQAALAQQAQAQQQAAARNAQAQSAFAQAQGGAFTGLATGSNYAGQMAGRASQADIANMIAQRIAESNMGHREAILEARGKRADTKALYGATRLKNLLELRGGEREYDLAKNPGVKRNIMEYQGLPTHKTVDVNNKYNGLPKPGVSGGVSGSSKPKKRPKKRR